MTRAWFLLVAFSLAGCGVGRQISAPVADYEAYRKTRIAPTLEHRLTASWRYLSDVPAGRFRPEVRAWFDASEPVYFAKAHDHLERLRVYLDALPNGPHARDAADRIVELELALSFERRRDRRLTEQARDVEERLGAAQDMRRELVRQFAGWAERLAKVNGFGRPTSELDHEFIFAWRIQSPAARCTGTRCTKTVSLPYAVPEAKKLRARRAIYDVTVELDTRGGVTRVVFTGPELFSRVAEAAEVRPIAGSDELGRAEAISRALEIASHAVEIALPADRCAREPVSPIVLERECDGRRLRMTAAATLEDEDHIEIVPVPSVPAKAGKGDGS